MGVDGGATSRGASLSKTLSASTPFIIDIDDGGLYDVEDITAAAEERFFRTGSENPGTGSGLRIFLYVVG